MPIGIGRGREARRTTSILAVTNAMLHAYQMSQTVLGEEEYCKSIVK
jgi:hypothetical protein